MKFAILIIILVSLVIRDESRAGGEVRVNGDFDACKAHLMDLKNYAIELRSMSAPLREPTCGSESMVGLSEIERGITSARTMIQFKVRATIAKYDFSHLTNGDCTPQVIERARDIIEKEENISRDLLSKCSKSVTPVEPCPQKAFPEAISGASREMIAKTRNAMADFARRDIREACEWIRMGNMISEKSQAAVDRFNAFANRGDKLGALEAMKPFIPTGEYWELSLLANSRLKAHQSYHFGTSQFTLSEARESLSKPYAPEALESTPIELEAVRKFEMPPMASTAFCGAIKLKLIGGCPGALEKNINEMIPKENKNGSQVTAADEFKEIFNDERYVKPLRGVALKMLDYMKDPVMTEGSNLFDDVMREFSKPDSGFKGEEARDAAWKTLAVLAATGPNMYQRVIHQDEEDLKAIHPTALALAVIAQSIPHLDTQSMGQDKPRPYSLPKSVNFTCDSGKTYHFWLSAYLARKRLKEGVSAEGARGAAFAANLGYQLKAPSREGKSDYAATRTMPRFNYIENSIRMDLSLSSSGAAFGVDEKLQSGAKSVNLNGAFADFIGAGGTQREEPKPLRLTAEGDQAKPEWRQVLTQFDHWNPSFIFDRVKE